MTTRQFLRRYGFAVGAGAALLVVLAIVFVSWRSTRSSLAASRSVTHTHEMLSTLEKTIADVVAAESAQRLYVITGTWQHAQDSFTTRPQIEADLKRLIELTADNAAQQTLARDLALAIGRKLQYVDNSIVVRERFGFEAAQRLISAGGGADTMRRVQDDVAKMRAAEERLLQERRERLERQASRTIIVLAAGAVADLVLITLLFILVARDIRRRAELNRALALARDSALHAAELRSQFLANMSHEIRTPMNGIIGMTGLLLGTKLDADQRDLAETVRTSADALLAIINDILDFSKIEAGKLLIESGDFDVRTTVESVIDLFTEPAHAQEVEIGALFDQDIPPMLRGDAGRIRQVLTNLVANAVKFTSEGEVIVHLNALRGGDESITVRFSVTDTGIGMSEDVMSRLFQPFSQADATTTRQYGGTGLGLAISKQLVELMGGTIGVESAEGKGSTFWFTLPLELTESEAIDRPDLRGLRVLVVDDNVTNRRVLRHSLEAWNMISGEAGSGSEALILLHEAAKTAEPYRLALVDMVMPGMDGLTLARTIKADPALGSMRLVMLTSLGASMDTVTLHDAGIDAALAKPVKQSPLFDAIASAIAGREPMRRGMEEPGAEADAPPRENIRVLIAEDNPVNQKLAVRQLKRLGIFADAVGNGVEAVETLSRIPYDLVLMDCQMPEMDGFEATRLIRKREANQRHTPIVALTANALQGDRERCLDAGMDDYLAKPVSEKQLIAVLERWLPIRSAEPSIQNNTVEYLRDLGGDDENFFRDVVDLYVQDGALRLGALRTALAEQDPAALASAAHALKSSSGHIGAMKVRDLCATIEQLGRSGSMKGSGLEIDKLAEEHEKAVAELRSLL